MLKMPDEFHDIPEALKLREAETRFDACLKREKEATQRSGERVHLISEELRQAQEELHTAQAAFDAATGEPKPAELTPAVVDEIAKHFLPDQHRDVRELLENHCGRTIPFRREAAPLDLEWTRLAVLRLSKGNLAELRKWVEHANIDERDVVYAGLPMMKGHRNT